MAIEFMEIQVTKNKKDTVGGLSGSQGVYESVFVGEDGYENRISGNEIRAVRVEIGVPWLAADSNLEQVGKTH